MFISKFIIFLYCSYIAKLKIKNSVHFCIIDIFSYFFILDSFFIDIIVSINVWLAYYTFQLWHVVLLPHCEKTV